MSGSFQPVVTGVGLSLAGADDVLDLVKGPVSPAAPVDPAARLGKKGLKYKDRATQLGLCAAFAALHDAGLRNGDGPLVDGARFGVVVASNYGNVETVCRVVTTIAAQTTRGTSPMDSPNASSNIIASEVAIRFTLRGPNLTVCNGDSSGVDALRWAASLLRSARADQVLVIGVEPDNEMVRKLVGADRVVDGGVAVVLEREGTARERGLKARARMGSFVRTGGVEECVHRLGCGGGGAPGGWYAPETFGDDPRVQQLDGVPRHELPRSWGTYSGVLGLAQCAAAVGRFDAGEHRPLYALAGRDDDGVAGVVLLAPGDDR